MAGRGPQTTLAVVVVVWIGSLGYSMLKLAPNVGAETGVGATNILWVYILGIIIQSTCAALPWTSAASSLKMGLDSCFTYTPS